ncbi:uncharacterized protein LOC124259328 [Haliotis rubra]|uniref:uncharacterized protein LOC124259328 n=1 Tax=Haliotis rubra TaxID=36100 RepID=UPI001EE53DC4|nr:uncharacterized protein LOC124259328 [Haliotis rubra]
MAFSSPRLIRHAYDPKLVIMMVLFSYNVSSDQCDECLVKYSKLFDNLVVFDNHLWSRSAPHQQFCFRLCLLDTECFSFQFNSNTNICRGHASTFTSPHLVNTSTETGNKLYLTCKGENLVGATCRSDTDCVAMGTVCLLGICKCRSNFSTDTWSCDSNYLGCYRDYPTRVLPHPYFRNDMTPEVCIAYCTTQGYRLAATQAGSQCFCGNSIPADQSRYDENNCGRLCAGDVAQICGGSWFMSVYSTGHS